MIRNKTNLNKISSPANMRRGTCPYEFSTAMWQAEKEIEREYARFSAYKAKCGHKENSYDVNM